MYADLAHLVERNLAKVEVAGSSPVIRSRNNTSSVLFFNKGSRKKNMAPWPSGKAQVCKTSIPRSESEWRLQKIQLVGVGFFHLCR